MLLSRNAGLLVALAVVGLAGCGSGLRVATDWNPARADAMRSWQTYDWLDHTDGERPYEDLDDVRIREAIARNLAARGFTQVRAGQSPDFLVAHHLGVEEHLVVHDPPYYAGWYGWSRPWSGPAYVDEVRTGLLVVDIVDPATNELVWRGVAESPALGRLEGPDERRTQVREAVDEMFAELPFRRGAAATTAPAGS